MGCVCTLCTSCLGDEAANATCCPKDSLLACVQTALNLSDAQLQDLLHVQHLLLVKSTLLDLERKAVVEPLIQPEQVRLPHDNFAALEADSNRLKDNLRQVTKVRLAAGTAVFAGVRSHVCLY